MSELSQQLHDHALDDDNMVLMSCAASRIDFLESELARLREAIEKHREETMCCPTENLFTNERLYAALEKP